MRVRFKNEKNWRKRVNPKPINQPANKGKEHELVLFQLVQIDFLFLEMLPFLLLLLLPLSLFPINLEMN